MFATHGRNPGVNFHRLRLYIHTLRMKYFEAYVVYTNDTYNDPIKVVIHQT